jgi:formamidopyrimidine-DNA glycosylase
MMAILHLRQYQHQHQQTAFRNQQPAFFPMPELPEVEHAAAIARGVTVGRTITSVTVRHRSQRRGLPAKAARSLAGDRVLSVERRGKSQRFRLASGRELRVHFRMTGDWLVPGPGPLPPTVRAVLSFDDGSRLALDDPRALSVLSLCAIPNDDDGLGPDAMDPGLTGRQLAGVLSSRRIPIKVALLDQSVLAGVGNIYASEALWRSRIDPRTPAFRLTAPRLTALLRAVRATLTAALKRQARYYGGETSDDSGRFAVYDREGEPCRRCRTSIKRITQAARSTYYCPKCQK